MEEIKQLPSLSIIKANVLRELNTNPYFNLSYHNGVPIFWGRVEKSISSASSLKVIHKILIDNFVDDQEDMDAVNKLIKKAVDTKSNVDEIKQINSIPIVLPNNLDEEVNLFNELYNGHWHKIWYRFEKDLIEPNPQLLQNNIGTDSDIVEDLLDDQRELKNENIITVPYRNLVKSYFYWIALRMYNRKYGEYDNLIDDKDWKDRKKEIYLFSELAIKGRWMITDYTDPRESIDEIKQLEEAQYKDIFPPPTMGKLSAQSAQSLQQLTGGKNMIQVAMTMASLLPQVIQAEQGYEDELEQLAIQIIKDSYPIVDYAGIIIDVKIEKGAGVKDLGGEENDIEVEQNPKFDEIKRRIINAITQGAAQRGTFNYMMFKDYLDQINPELINKYTELMKHVFGQFDDDQAIAFMLAILAMQKSLEGGSEEISWNEDGSNLVIHARAVCFPMLVHEIIKGLYEILSLQGFGADKERNKTVVKNVDKLDNEPEDMRYGKFIYDALTNLYSQSNFDDPRIRELFFTEIYKLDDDQFKSFIDNAINDSLTSRQKQWALNVMRDIEKDLKHDDAGLDEIKQLPKVTPEFLYKIYMKKMNQMKDQGIHPKNSTYASLDHFKIYSQEQLIQLYNTYVKNGYLSEIKQPTSLKELFQLTEYSEKIMKTMRERFKKQNSNLDIEIIDYYINRFDQLKNSLSQKLKNNDPEFTKIVPHELLQNNKFLDILQWRRWTDLEQVIDKFPAPPSAAKKAIANTNTAETDADEVYSKDGIEVYKGNSQNRCVKYGHGMGNSYSWCISRTDVSNMYSTYRFMSENSRMFYFIFDRSRSSRQKNGQFEDIYHAIVIHVFEDGRYAVTTADNPGEDKVKNWEDLARHMPAELWNKIKGLKGLLTYIQPSQEEKELAALKGKKLTLDQFIELSYNTKLLYINGGNKLTPEQIDTLDTELKNQYINQYQVMPFESVSDNMPLIKRYIKIHFQRAQKPIAIDYLEYMDDQQREEYWNKYKDEPYFSYEHVVKYFPKHIKEFLRDYVEGKHYIPDYMHKYMEHHEKQDYDRYSPLFANSNVIKTEDFENMIPNYYYSPDTITYEQFKKIHPDRRKVMMEYVKGLIEKDLIKKYYSIDATLPPYKIENNQLLFQFNKNWIGYEDSIYEDWNKYTLMKKAGLIK